MVLKEWLLLGWSPEAISFRFTVELSASCRVCHSTLYNWIEADRTAGGKLSILSSCLVSENVAEKAENASVQGCI